MYDGKRYDAGKYYKAPSGVRRAAGIRQSVPAALSHGWLCGCGTFLRERRSGGGGHGRPDYEYPDFPDCGPLDGGLDPDGRLFRGKGLFRFKGGAFHLSSGRADSDRVSVRSLVSGKRPFPPSHTHAGCHLCGCRHISAHHFRRAYLYLFLQCALRRPAGHRRLQSGPLRPDPDNLCQHFSWHYSRRRPENGRFRGGLRDNHLPGRIGGGASRLYLRQGADPAPCAAGASPESFLFKENGRFQLRVRSPADHALRGTPSGAVRRQLPGRGRHRGV